MSGAKNGVATVIASKESRVIFTHCYGHALNLGVGDTIKQCQLMKSALDVMGEISKLIKLSPKRDAVFQKLKADLAPETPGFRVYSAQLRWTVRAASLQCVLDNYEVLFGVWSDALSSKLDGEMRARIIGVDAQMHAFDFLYGVSLGCLLLCHTDNLSKSLQEKSLAAAERQRLAKLTLDVLVSLRDENNFKNFYACVHPSSLSSRCSYSTKKAKSPSTIASWHNKWSNLEDRYRQIYYEALDFLVQAVKDRFDQPGYQVYRNYSRSWS